MYMYASMLSTRTSEVRCETERLKLRGFALHGKNASYTDGK